jgi:hypothetical protein
MRLSTKSIAPRLPFADAYPLTAASAARYAGRYAGDRGDALRKIAAARLELADCNAYGRGFHVAGIIAQRAYLANLRAARAIHRANEA